MQYQYYIETSEKLLADFEKTQAQMLHLDLINAGNDFQKQITKIARLLRHMSKDLENNSFKNNKNKILIIKQIKRLLVFLKEMNLHIHGFFLTPPPNENEIIFIFERQHLFKNIYRKHLSDITVLIH